MEKESACEHIGGKWYCYYCANELKPEEHWEEYNKWETISCDCEGATLEKKANVLLREANFLKKEYKLNELRYKVAIKELKYKFGIR